ncbi:uncharacterized protein LOC132255560 isoform X1 [Phlebotomus argentipes]|uniref:uncharacterized protein LOC132255560 isoform X1 n=1 Tax=Phlebotomus argentipes TaxID=94469 RepID=UPI0028932AEA|nr:uncharacterized protein LOC132255560 isoform X1 [Phlebotomus argentipes]
MQPQMLKAVQMTKAQSKVYPETNGERIETPPQSSPISYTVPDASRYGATTGVSKSSPVANSRHSPAVQQQQQQSFQQVTPPYRHFQTPKVAPDVEVSFTRVGKSSSGSDSAASEAKTPSQASPQMAAAYPMYNSPMNSMSSPQQPEQHYPPRSPLDVTISRANVQNPVAYSSVITRAVADATRYGQDGRVAQQNCWDTTRSGYAEQQNTSASTGITILQDLSNCRGDPMSIVRALQQAEQQQQPASQETEKTSAVPKRRQRKVASDKSGDSDKEEEYYQGRIPPPAHSAEGQRAGGQNGQQQQQQQQQPHQQNGGSYIDFERWNLPPPPPKMASSAFSGQAGFGQTPQSLMVPHPHAPLPYFPAFHLATAATSAAAEFSVASSEAYASNVDVYQQTVADPHSSSNSNDVASNLGGGQREDEPPKVVVPNIEEELGFLAERGGGATTTASGGGLHQQQQHVVGSAMQPATMASSGQQQEEQNIAKSIAEKKYNLPKGVGSGFMGSYLKFLQGERDTSPPPASRGGRKATWSRTAAASTAGASQTTATASTMKSGSGAAAAAAANYQQQQQQQISNGVNIHSQQIIQSGQHQQQQAEMDDRYYHQAARNNSKRKYDEEEERRGKAKAAEKNDVAKEAKKPRAQPQPQLQTLQPAPSVVQPTAAPPHLPLHPHPHHHHPQPPPQMMQQSYYQQPDEEVPQRREMSHRKAKGRSVLQLLNMSLDSEDFAGAVSDDEPAEFQDSDTDPVWTPGVDEEDEEWEQGRKRTRKSRENRNRSRRVTPDREAELRDFLPMKDNVQEEVVSLDHLDDEMHNKGSVIHMQLKPNGQKVHLPDMTNDNHEGFKVGQFIVNLQDEMTHEWPKLWRVDGKNLIEKYEPILKAGKIVYRNESVFAALLQDAYGSYRVVKVNPLHIPTDFRGRQNSVIEWLRDGVDCVASVVKQEQFVQPTSHQQQSVIREVAPPPPPLVDLGSEVLITPFDRLMQEKAVYQEHFEIYIQTLISQALDPNFLTEILQENDEYFLASVRAIDSLVDGLKTRLLTARPISRNFHAAVEMWPQYEVLQLGANYPPQIACTSCLRAVASLHVRFSGQLYNVVTMTAREMQDNLERDFTLCPQCSENLRIHHRMSHQKYRLFMSCTQKVQQLNVQDPTKTSTAILNELLANDAWLEELFKNVRQSWVELELLVDPQGVTRY